MRGRAKSTGSSGGAVRFFTHENPPTQACWVEMLHWASDLCRIVKKLTTCLHENVQSCTFPRAQWTALLLKTADAASWSPSAVLACKSLQTEMIKPAHALWMCSSGSAAHKPGRAGAEQQGHTGKVQSLLTGSQRVKEVSQREPKRLWAWAVRKLWRSSTAEQHPIMQSIADVMRTFSCTWLLSECCCARAAGLLLCYITGGKRKGAFPANAAHLLRLSPHASSLLKDHDQISGLVWDLEWIFHFNMVTWNSLSVISTAGCGFLKVTGGHPPSSSTAGQAAASPPSAAKTT